MNKFILSTFFLVITTFIILGCGGGTRGSGGGLTFEGVVLTTEGGALSQATVTSVQTGDSAQTDEHGIFLLVTDNFTGSPKFIIEKDSLSVESEGGSITEEAKTVTVEIRVKTGNKPSATQSVSTKERKPGNSSSSSSSSSRSSSNSSNNSSAQSSSSSDSSGGSSSDSSQSSSSSDDDGDDNHSSSSSSSSSSSHSSSSSSSDSSKVELTGVIESIQGSTLTVRGRVFTVNGSTDFDDRDSLSDFSVGEEVEIKGKMISGVLIAQKIKFKD